RSGRDGAGADALWLAAGGKMYTVAALARTWITLARTGQARTEEFCGRWRRADRTRGELRAGTLALVQATGEAVRRDVGQPDHIRVHLLAAREAERRPGAGKEGRAGPKDDGWR